MKVVLTMGAGQPFVHRERVISGSFSLQCDQGVSGNKRFAQLHYFISFTLASIIINQYTAGNGSYRDRIDNLILREEPFDLIYVVGKVIKCAALQAYPSSDGVSYIAF